MYRTQILLEPEQHKTLTEIARQEKRSLSDILREMVDEYISEYKQKELAAAARALLADYQSDPEVVAFETLDGEDIHA